MGPTGHSERSVSKYQPTTHNIPEKLDLRVVSAIHSTYKSLSDLTDTLPPPPHNYAKLLLELYDEPNSVASYQIILVLFKKVSNLQFDYQKVIDVLLEMT